MTLSGGSQEEKNGDFYWSKDANSTAMIVRGKGGSLENGCVCGDVIFERAPEKHQSCSLQASALISKAL